MVYKLTYFDLRGLGEVSRLILHYANVKFEDDRIPYEMGGANEEWAKLKPSTPYGQLPVLEVDGVQIAQSYAIARFLARRHGLAGEDDVESAILDSIADAQRDFGTQAQPYFAVVAGGKEGDKDKLFEEVMLPALNTFWPNLEKRLAATGSCFFGKKGPTWVDFLIASGILTAKNFVGDELAKHPEILKHCERVHALPQLKSYLSTRKETKF